MSEEVITLFRPVGKNELKLIEDMNFRGFPPRLPEQPIFYPVTNEAYAAQIARDWNAKTPGDRGYVTRFKVRKAYLDGFEKQVVGGRMHEEYWIPAEDLPEFNDNILEPIEVIAEFAGPSQ